MAWWLGSVAIFWTLCALLSVITRREREFIETPTFVFVGIGVLFFGFAILIGGSAVVSRAVPVYGALYMLIGFVPGLVILVPWIHHSVKIFAEEGRRAVIGLDQMTVQKSYDAPEKLMHERKFDEAERAFLEAAGSEVDDPEPLRRAGEAALASGRVKPAIDHFRRALVRITSEEDRASLGIRIAEIEERRLNDMAGARRTLEGLLPGFKPGKWGDYVRERLSRMA